MISIKSKDGELVFTAEECEDLKLMLDLIELRHIPMPEDCWLHYVERLSPPDPVYLIQAINYGFQKMCAFSDNEKALLASDRFLETLMRKADEVEDTKALCFKKSDIDSLIWWSR